MDNILQVNEKLILNNLINLKQIVFEVTEKCNLNCKYCALSDLYTAYDVRENRDLPFEKAKLIIDYFLKLWNENYKTDAVFRASIGFYGGEPLMNMPLIQKIVYYLEQSEIKGKKFYYSMTTNAMLLDKHMDYLAEKQINLLISLDGDKASQSYRVNHIGENSFDQVFSNVKLLQDTYPDYFNESVRFISVLHNRNDVEPIYHFFKTNFNKEPTITTLNDTGILEGKKEEFKKMFQNKSMSIRKSKNCETIEVDHFINTPKGYNLSKNLFYLSGNIFFNYNQLLFNEFNKNVITTGTCTPFEKRLFVSASGKILPCERIDHDFSLGFVHDDFIELDYKQVAERHNHFLSKHFHQCMYCGHKKLCPTCIYQTDGIRGAFPLCECYSTEKEANHEKNYIFNYLRQHPQYYEKVLNEIGFTV